MKIRCPQCDARLKVRDELRGRTGVCPRCQRQLLLEPESDEVADLLAADLAAADADAGLPMAPALRMKKKRKSKQGVRFVSLNAWEEEDESDDADEEEEQDRAKPKKRRRSSKPTTWALVESVAAPEFWRSAMDHLPYMAGTLLLVGGLLGFLMGLVRSEFAAGIIVQAIGLPTMLFTFLMSSYPMSCVCKVLVGSTDGERNSDIAEWPEPGMGAWIFDMFFVAYLVVMSLVLCAGVAKLREVTLPDQLPSKEYWQIFGHVDETNTIHFAPKFLGENFLPVSVDVTSSRPVVAPGPAWWTVFGALIFVLPFFTISCLDPGTPMLIPWSTQAMLSLFKNFLAWLLVVCVTAALLFVAAIVFIWGASYAPFWTFTLCSPMAACCLLIYARILGRLAWLIAS